MSKRYRVVKLVQYREVYVIDAESQDDAERLADGDLGDPWLTEATDAGEVSEVYIDEHDIDD